MVRKPSVCESEVSECCGSKVMWKGGILGTVGSVNLDVCRAHYIRLLRGPQATFSSVQGQCAADSGSGCRLSSLHLLQVRSYMRQILEGICYLHQHSVLHLDIKVSAGLYRLVLPGASSEGLLVHWLGSGPAGREYSFPGESPCHLPSSPLLCTVL